MESQELKQLIFDLRHKPPLGKVITNSDLALAANIIESLDEAVDALIKERDELIEELNRCGQSKS